MPILQLVTQQQGSTHEPCLIPLQDGPRVPSAVAVD